MPAALDVISSENNDHYFVGGDYDYKNYFFNVKCNKCNIYGKLYQQYSTKTIYVERRYYLLSCEECLIKNIIE